MSANPLERFVLPESIKRLTPEDVLHRIEHFVDQCPGMGGIIIIGHEGDTHALRCRPTHKMESAKIRDALRFAIVKGDSGDMIEEQFETLVLVPGMRRWSVRETLQRIQQFLGKCIGLTMVLVLCRDGNLDKIQCLHSENLSADAVRATLRNALAQYDNRSLPPPAA